MTCWLLFTGFWLYLYLVNSVVFILLLLLDMNFIVLIVYIGSLAVLWVGWLMCFGLTVLCFMMVWCFNCFVFMLLCDCFVFGCCVTWFGCFLGMLLLFIGVLIFVCAVLSVGCVYLIVLVAYFIFKFCVYVYCFFAVACLWWKLLVFMMFVVFGWLLFTVVLLYYGYGVDYCVCLLVVGFDVWLWR